MTLSKLNKANFIFNSQYYGTIGSIIFTNPVTGATKSVFWGLN